MPDEKLYSVSIPERRGAIRQLLRALSPVWNITLLHYRKTGKQRSYRQSTTLQLCLRLEPNPVLEAGLGHEWPCRRSAHFSLLCTARLLDTCGFNHAVIYFSALACSLLCCHPTMHLTDTGVTPHAAAYHAMLNMQELDLPQSCWESKCQLANRMSSLLPSRNLPKWMPTPLLH